MTLKRILQLLFFISLFNTHYYAQFKLMRIGATVGIGEIKGNSPSVTSFGASIFADFLPWFTDDISFRTEFTYARKIEYFLPENRQNRFYPFIMAFSLKSVLNLKFSKLIFIESNTGLTIINDRTFSDVNLWEPGVTFGVAGGFDFTNDFSNGLKLSLGINSGIAFTKTNATYYLISTQLQYCF